MRTARINVNKVLRLREAGISLKSIANLCNCSTSGVSHIIKDAGLSEEGYAWREPYDGYRIPRNDKLLARLHEHHRIEDVTQATIRPGYQPSQRTNGSPTVSTRYPKAAKESITTHLHKRRNVAFTATDGG